jgi:hypothetical protein
MCAACGLHLLLAQLFPRCSGGKPPYPLEAPTLPRPPLALQAAGLDAGRQAPQPQHHLPRMDAATSSGGCAPMPAAGSAEPAAADGDEQEQALWGGDRMARVREKNRNAQRRFRCACVHVCGGGVGCACARMTAAGPLQFAGMAILPCLFIRGGLEQQGCVATCGAALGVGLLAGQPGLRLKGPVGPGSAPGRQEMRGTQPPNQPATPPPRHPHHPYLSR